MVKQGTRYKTIAIDIVKEITKEKIVLSAGMNPSLYLQARWKYLNKMILLYILKEKEANYSLILCFASFLFFIDSSILLIL